MTQLHQAGAISVKITVMLYYSAQLSKIAGLCSVYCCAPNIVHLS